MSKTLLAGVLLFAVSCVASSEDAESGDRSEADETEWVEVTECQGFDLCLSEIIAARDLRDPEGRLQYPMRHALAEVFDLPEKELEVVGSCASPPEVDDSGNLVCQTDEDLLEVAKAKRESTTDVGMRIFFFDYEATGRARLFRDAASEGRGRFQLVIQ